MRLALVTTCRNPGGLIRDTVASVFAQRVDAGAPGVLVDYCIIDAASEDGTVDYLRGLEPPAWMRLTVRSEPDRGLYDGLWKGFGLVDGDWYGWVNAGDLLAPGCHRALSVIGATTPDAVWVTGLQVNHDRTGDIYRAATPLRFRNDMLRRGLYGRTALPFVQQESTFWRRELQATIPSTFAELRLAGDLWLWSHFARQLQGARFPLAVAAIHLGGWRAHGEHLGGPGGDLSAYLAEARARVGRVGLLDRVAGALEEQRWRRSERGRKRSRQRTLYLHGDRVAVRTGRGRAVATTLRRVARGASRFRRNGGA